MKEYSIAPSDFAFLYDESKWAFYLKYVGGIKRPPLILPKIFNVIDSSIKECYEGQDFSQVCKDLPQGIMKTSDKWVKSIPITNPDYDVSVSIIGKIDAYFELPDGTNSIIDFKTSEVKEDFAQKYNRQLHAYCYGVTKPANSNCLKLENLTNPGLIVFEPSKFMIDYNGRAGIRGKVVWQSFDLDIDSFRSFISNEVIPLLAGPEPKPEDSDPYWKYLQQFGFAYEQE